METFFYKKKKLKLTHNFFLQKTTKKTSFTQYANLQNKFSVRSSKTKATSVKNFSSNCFMILLQKENKNLLLMN